MTSGLVALHRFIYYLTSQKSQSLHMKELYFVRHGQTEWNAIARMQGQWNSDLSDLGKQQADVNGKFLATQAIEAMYVSPLTRTQQTAEIINQHVGATPVLDDRIMEWDCGDWSGYLYAEVQQKWAEEWAALEADRFNYRGPNCENYPDMIARSSPFIDEVLATEHQRIAIVSHGMIGRVMASQLLGYSPQQTLSLHQDNDTIYRVTVDGPSRELANFVGGDGPHPGIAG